MTDPPTMPMPGLERAVRTRTIALLLLGTAFLAAPVLCPATWINDLCPNERALALTFAGSHVSWR